VPGLPRAHVVDDDQPQAFCTGMLRPRIYVTQAALELLGDDERAAVLAHETHHARRRDPLRLLVARALAEGLFFLPVVRRLPERYAALAELAADQAAAAGRGGRRALASALLTFDEHPSPAVGIAPERVEHLLGERPRWELPTLLLLGALATIAALVAVTVRLAEATAHATLGLPALAAQACALAMALAPIAIGAMALLGGRRLGRRRPAA
jgi:beta-lactamase regulating signal transducer with metallopeptidase domain